MSNFKKIVSMALAFVMVLGLMAPAFALSNDVAGTEYEDAAALLGALDIMVGDAETGNFRPEDTIRRSEFAKVAVLALGLGSAAEAANGTTQFPDVVENHWAAGYINVAAGQGIIKGDAEGTFRPDANISYAEALTVLVRALGYKDSFLTGAWPANFIAKAAELDITDGVSVGTSNAATRGNVAKLLVNTLDAKIIKQTSYGDENSWSDVGQPTLLKEKLNITKVEKAIVTATPKVESSIDENQLTVDANPDYNNGNNFDGTYDVVADSINIDSFLGLSVNVFLNNDNEIIYVEKSESPSKVVYDVIDYEEDIKADSITLKNSDKEYEFGTGYKIYLDNDEVSVSTLASNVTTSSDVVFGKFVFDTKGNIAVADLQKFDGDKARIVLEVDADDAKIVYNVTDADDEKVLDLGDTDDFDKYVITDVNGNAMDIADVQKDDILYVNTQDVNSDELKEAASGDTVAYVTVVRNVVEGAAESYDANEIEIAGKAYKWSTHATATVSIDNDAEYESVGTAAANSDLDDTTDIEANVVALRDLVGKVRHIRAEVESSSNDIYGIITGTEKRYNEYYVKVLNNDGAEVEYELDLNSNDFGTAAGKNGYHDEATIAVNDVVKYTVDSDNKINTIEFIAAYNGSTQAATVTSFSRNDKDGNAQTIDPTGLFNTSTDKFGADYIKVSGGTILVKDDVITMDYTKATNATTGAFDPADAETITWTNLDDKQGNGSEFVYVADNNGIAKFVIFTKSFSATNDAEAGYIVDARTKNGDKVVDVMAPGYDEVQRYTVKANSGLAVDESLVFFNVRNDGKVDLNSTATDFTVWTGVVSDISGKYMTVSEVTYRNTVNGVAKFYVNTGATNQVVKVASDSIFYSKDKAKVFSDISEGKTFVTVIAENGVVKAVKIFDKEDDKVKFITAQEAQNAGLISITGSESDVTKIDME